MGFEAYPTRAQTPDIVDHDFLITGTGASNPTNTEVPGGWTVTRNGGVGLFRVAASFQPGRFIRPLDAQIIATTGGAMKGFTVEWQPWDATNLRIDFRLYDSQAAPALIDLAATQFIGFGLRFSRNAFKA